MGPKWFFGHNLANHLLHYAKKLFTLFKILWKNGAKKNGFYENLVHVVIIIDIQCKKLFRIISRQSSTYLGTAEHWVLIYDTLKNARYEHSATLLGKISNEESTVFKKYLHCYFRAVFMAVHMLILFSWHSPAEQVPPFLGANLQQRWTNHSYKLFNTTMQ